MRNTMSLNRMAVVTACLLIFICCTASSYADTIRFEWTDSQGQDGTFTLDTALGFTPEAFSEFSYIFFDDSPTPIGYQPEGFTSFADGLAWDINTGGEGVTFLFDQPILEPLPTDVSFYQNAFQSGNYISASGSRTWDSATITAVPEPSAAISVTAACLLLLVRRRRLA